MLSPTFPVVDLPHLANMPLPPMAARAPDPPEAASRCRTSRQRSTRRWRARAVSAICRSGASVAVAVGSRGIAHIPKVVAAAVKPPEAARLRAVHRAGDGQPRRRHRRGPGGGAGPSRRHRGDRRRAGPRDDGDGRVRRDAARHPLPVRQERRRRRRGPVHQPGQVAHQLRPADRERADQADRGRARQAGGRAERASPRPARLHRGAAGARPDRDRAFADRLWHRAGRECRQAADGDRGRRARRTSPPTTSAC